MNEVLDRIERVVVDAARRRVARRRRRMVVAAVAVGMLGLVSAASAVTGVGPIGNALTSDDELPPGAKPAPGGASVTLTATSADGRRHEVRVYRRNPDRRGRLRDLPGAHHYCAASYSADARGRREPIMIGCTLGTAFAARLVDRRLWLDCTGRGGIVGAPATPDPVCGLTLADTTSVDIDPDRGSAGEVKLSEPFELRVDHDPAIVGRESLDLDTVRRLPDTLRVRAILGVVDAPPTAPGGHEPRIAVTATAEDGSTVTASVGGDRVMRRTDLPSMDPRPEPDGPVARVNAGGWTVKAWRTRATDHCAGAAPVGERRARAFFCLWAPELGRFRSLVREGAQATARDEAVFGLVRADATEVEVRSPAGEFPAALSRPWAAVRRQAGDLERIPARFRKRFAGLPRSLRVRAFLVRPPVAPRARDVTVVTRLPDGRVLRSRPSAHRAPWSGTGLPPMPVVADG